MRTKRSVAGAWLALAVACLALVGAEAGATPVTVYADGTTSYGFDPADVAAAIGAGLAPPNLVTGLGNGGGKFSVTTPDGIPGVKGKNKENPSKGTSTWTLRVAPDAPAELLRNFCLVVLGHDPGDPLGYKTGNVGLQIDTSLPWLLVEPSDGGPTYLAFRLGDLVAGGTYEIPIEYRVGQRLKKKNGVFTFPRYSIAFLSVPEPGALALALGALAGLAAARRKAQ